MLSLGLQLQLSKCPWKEHKADNGKVYFHNSVTKESRWTKPKELEELEGMISYGHCPCQGSRSVASVRKIPVINAMLVKSTILDGMILYYFDHAGSSYL